MKTPKLFINRSARLGFAILVAFALVAVFAPWIAPFDPNMIDLAGAFGPPSWVHWFGQDSKGADLFSRVLYGTRISLTIALCCVLLSSVIGTLYGAFSAQSGGLTDKLCMMVVDIFLAFPGFLLAIALAAFLGEGFFNVIFAISLVGWVPYARLARAEVLSVKQKDFVLAAHAMGTGRSRIFFRHILPNILAPITIQATFGMAGAIIIEGSLSFLGLGVPPNIPSWGAMLNAGRNYILIAQHLSLFPGMAIMLLVMGFNFVGDGLRDALDPKLQQEGASK